MMNLLTMRGLHAAVADTAKRFDVSEVTVAQLATRALEFARDAKQLETQARAIWALMPPEITAAYEGQLDEWARQWLNRKGLRAVAPPIPHPGAEDFSP